MEAWLLERRFTVISSDRILEEVERALAKPYFARCAPIADRRANVELLRREAAVVTPRTPVRGVATHPEDDQVLAAALDGGADYLVTGDRSLLGLGSFRGIPIVSASEFVEVSLTA